MTGRHRPPSELTWWTVSESDSSASSLGCWSSRRGHVSAYWRSRSRAGNSVSARWPPASYLLSTSSGPGSLSKSCPVAVQPAAQRLGAPLDVGGGLSATGTAGRGRAWAPGGTPLGQRSYRTRPEAAYAIITSG